MFRNSFVLTTLGTCVAGLLVSTPSLAQDDAPAQEPEAPQAEIVRIPIENSCDREESRQFNFWHGAWKVTNHYLTGEGMQEVGTAEASITPIFGGCAAVELWKGNLGDTAIHGFSLRAFDPKTEKWRIVLNWPTGENVSFGVMEGKFADGKGEFFPQLPEGAETPDQLTRFTFSDATATSCQWAMANTEDGGANWTTSWIMKFARQDAAEAMTLDKLFRPREEEDMTSDPEAARFDFGLKGMTGKVHRTESDGMTVIEGKATYRSARILDGRAVIGMRNIEMVDGSGHQEFFVAAYIPSRQTWQLWTIDDITGELNEWEGAFKYGRAAFEREQKVGEDTVRHRIIWSIPKMGLINWNRSHTFDGKNWFTTLRVNYTRPS